MKKLLFPLLFLLNYSPSHATQSSGSESKVVKCLGATTLLLSTLSGIDGLQSGNSAIQGLNKLKKDLQNQKYAEDLVKVINKKDYKLARQLLKDKPKLNINARFGKFKRTCLMKCCYNGDESIDVVKDILGYPRLDITLKNDLGANCLHYACNLGRPKIIGLLLERDDIDNILNAIDLYGMTPLDDVIDQIINSCAKIEHVTIWNMMVAKGAVLNTYKQEYKKLNNDDFKPPHSHYVDLINLTQPGRQKFSKTHFMRRR